MFDQLQRNQKLVVLCEAARALLKPDHLMPELTAVLEAAVATVFTYANDQLIAEMDDPELAAATSDWRRLVLAAALESDAHYELPDVASMDECEWTLLLECQVDRVLWDNDYESQIGLDLPPEQNSRLLAVMGRWLVLRSELLAFVGREGDQGVDVSPTTTSPPCRPIRRTIKSGAKLRRLDSMREAKIASVCSTACATLAVPLAIAHAVGAKVTGTGVTFSTALNRAHDSEAQVAVGVPTPGAPHQ